MTKETQNGKSNSETSMIPGFDPTAVFQNFMSNFSEASAGGGNPAAGRLETNQQWMNFLGERFKRDSALLQKLSTCKNPADVSAAYMEFSKEAVENYQREFSEMTKLSQQAIGQLTKTSQAGTD